MSAPPGRRPPIEASPCLDRILALPTRESDPPVLPLPDLGGTLRPVQARALAELLTYRGAFVSARVGAGKTLISLLAGTVLGAERPLLVVPAKLREKTAREALEYYDAGWKVKIPEVRSYEVLGRVSGADVLEEIRPDLIILDEAHKVSNRSAAVTRRMGRYLWGRSDVAVLAMSGTLTRRDLKDFAHIAEWCAGSRAPVPTKWSTLEGWSSALGASTDPWDRPALGALHTAFAPEAAVGLFDDPLPAVREGYARRIWSTPGFVQTTDGLPGVGLEISLASWKVPPAADAALKSMLRTWATPGGDEITSAVELYAHARELSQGFYYRWTEVPPDGWLEARRAWRSWVRGVLTGSRTYDSPFQVEKAVQDGRLVTPTYRPWVDIRGSFTPVTEAVWVSHDLVDAVAAHKFEGPTIVWVEHDAVGAALAAKGVPYFGAGGLRRLHRGGPSESIEAAPARGIVAASISANAEGRNLQSWGRNLVLSPPGMGSTWEQLLGRTHRDGQQADVVDVMVYAPTDLHLRSLTQAKAYAKYIAQTTGQEQKILSATWNFQLPQDT